MILVIDNYDSFVHNLARYLRRLGQETTVIRNDACDPETLNGLTPTAVVLSPGPCTPQDSGCTLDVLKHHARRLPILGICLGHQAIAEFFGATVSVSGNPMHGRVSDCHHESSEMFAGIPSPFTVGRYHSLVVEPDSVPDEIRVTASINDGTIMAIEHRTRPIVGLQFHPESILTEYGVDLLRNFLSLAALPHHLNAEPSS